MYETYIVPVLRNNNITVFTWTDVTMIYCTAAYTIAMTSVLYGAKTWLQKKENLLCDMYCNYL